jgi:outer membrane protein insertion porin family
LKSNCRIQPLLVLLFLCIAGLVFSSVPLLAESPPLVLTIDIQGNNHVPAEKIFVAVEASQIGEPMDSQRVRRDVESIMALGYFTDVRPSYERMLDGVKLVFIVTENPLFKEVRISGLTKIKPEELQPSFTQKPGDVFNTLIFRGDLTKALKFCREKKGLLIDPKLDSLEISPDGIVTITMIEIRYGKISVTGLEKTKEDVILRELSIKAGDIIDTNLLRDEYQKLMRLRLFDRVEPRFESSGIPEVLDLVIDVQEAKNTTLMVGLSFGQDDGKMSGLLEFSDNNTMGLGQTLSMNINYGDTRQNVQFSFNEPWLTKKHTSFGLSVWNSDTYSTSTMTDWGNPYDTIPNPDGTLYDMDLVQTGLSITMGRPFKASLTARIKLSLEQNSIENCWVHTSYDPDAHTGIPSLIILDGAPHKGDFWNNSIELSLIKNKLIYADARFVNDGYQWTLNYEFAGEYLGGEFDYQKISAEWKFFRPIGANMTWGNRFQYNALIGDYPDYDALYLGGMYRLRGYSDRRYDSDISKNFIGDQYFLVNSELRWRLPNNNNFFIVAFYDAGLIHNLSDDTAFGSDYGLGFRYNVPFLGLLRFDYARNSDGEDPRVVVSMMEMF